jgi:hypothetical protein
MQVPLDNSCRVMSKAGCFLREPLAKLGEVVLEMRKIFLTKNRSATRFSNSCVATRTDFTAAARSQ